LTWSGLTNGYTQRRSLDIKDYAKEAVEMDNQGMGKTRSTREYVAEGVSRKGYGIMKELMVARLYT